MLQTVVVVKHSFALLHYYVCDCRYTILAGHLGRIRLGLFTVYLFDLLCFGISVVLRGGFGSNDGYGWPRESPYFPSIKE